MHTRAYIIELPKQRPEKSVVFELFVCKRREAVKRTLYIKILYPPHYTSRHYLLRSLYATKLQISTFPPHDT